MELSEAQVSNDLVNRILAGDKTAETDMVNRYSRGLLFILRRKCGDQDLANDLEQDTWQIIIEKIRNNELKDPAKLSPFIIQTGKNLVIMHFRKSEQTKVNSSGDGNDIEINYPEASNSRHRAATPESILCAHNLGLMVKRVVLELNTSRDKDLIIRYYLNEQDKSTICHDLSIETNHFDKVLYRAKQRFRQLWIKQEESY